MVSALVLGSSDPGWSPGVIAMCSFNSRRASLHPGVEMGTGEFNAGEGGNPAIDKHPIQGWVEIFLVASCYRNQDKMCPYWPIGSHGDLTLYLSFSWTDVSTLNERPLMTCN